MKGFTSLLSFGFLSACFLLSASFASGQTATAGQILISEFRYRGPNGANDEFIELYNNSGADHTVTATSGTGYGVAASDGTTRCSIPNGTLIPNRGHYLCVNSTYSLASYPAGNGATANGDATYNVNIPDNVGIAVFNNNSGGASYSLANRLDAVGTTAELNTVYKEGTGLPSLSVFSIDYVFVRDECGKAGSITNLLLCPSNGVKDSNNNAVDFFFIDTAGTSIGAGQRLGAPGPQNLSSPRSVSKTSPTYQISTIDSCAGPTAAPNRVRDLTPDGPNNSTFGTVDLRFKVTNNTGADTTNIRFRIVDLTTFPPPSGFADLRPRTSGSTVVLVNNAPCSSGSINVTVNGTALETPPAQIYGGGFNSSLGTSLVSVGSPIPSGASEYFRILMGVQQNGLFKIGIYVETLPHGGTFHYFVGDTSNPTSIVRVETPFDFSGDRETDIGIFRPSNGQWWLRNSANGALSVSAFGLATDKVVAADYDGDGKVDLAVFRPSTGQWFIVRSGTGSFSVGVFGLSTDTPAPADYDGDGKADLTIFRPSTGTWWVQRSSDAFVEVVPFGLSADKPVPADYDGDFKSDIAIYRPSSGQWWVRYSGNGAVTAVTFGTSTDKAVRGDYTGDGRADYAFWRPSTGEWFVGRSEDLSYYSFPYGVSTDLPVPGDYDGDGINDAAVFRPASGLWFLRNSSNGATAIFNFGLATDLAVPNTIVP